jgi:membrane-associated protein
VYSLLFTIVLCESAFFPAAPFLPGDGLLFAVGLLAADGAVHVGLSIGIMILGGVLGNWIAYRLGKWMGPAIFDKVRWLNRDHYQQAHEFYVKHGNVALIFSRFIPLVRSLVPFVAGIAQMPPKSFRTFNILGVCIWVSLVVLIGYYLGHLPYVKGHFTLFVLGFSCIGILSVGVLGIRQTIKKTKNQKAD